MSILLKTSFVNEIDVNITSTSLGIDLTHTQVLKILEQYDAEQAKDPSATWDLVIESLIYDLTNNPNTYDNTSRT